MIATQCSPDGSPKVGIAITVSAWNTEWATLTTDRGHRIAAILGQTDSDVIVVIEGVRELLPDDGDIVDAGGDWGYGRKPDRRKVIVWSRFPLSLDMVGDGGAALGRLAVATATTPAGAVRIIGVCIPWRDAHVNTGRGDAQPWSEHIEYLDQMANLLAGLDGNVPTVIAGDFNQRIPRERQPVRVADRLNEILADWMIHTAGALANGPHIDHIATNGQLSLASVHDWPASDRLGRLSDHTGVSCRLAHAETSIRGSDHDLAVDHDETEQGDGGALTPELRAEIENILRRSGDGLSHGATFRLREEGLDDEQIATRRGVRVEATRVFLRSLDALLTGTLPTSKSAALTNSYVYRELLNHAISGSLDSYVKAQLRKLRAINSGVGFAPLKTRSHQYQVGKPKREKPIEDPCPECAAIGIVHAGPC